MVMSFSCSSELANHTQNAHPIQDNQGPLWISCQDSIWANHIGPSSLLMLYNGFGFICENSLMISKNKRKERKREGEEGTRTLT